MDKVICPECAGRGLIETRQMERGCGGWGYVTIDCPSCDLAEKRAALIEQAEEAGWYIEALTGDDEGCYEAWGKPGSYTFGDWMPRHRVPVGSIYQSRFIGSETDGSLWLCDTTVTPEEDENTSFKSEWRIATLITAHEGTEGHG